MKKEKTPESEKKPKTDTITHTRIFVSDLKRVDEIGKRENCVNRATALAWVLWRLESLERLYDKVVGRELSGVVRAKWHKDPDTGEMILLREDEP